MANDESKAIAELRAEVTKMAAENLAMQFILMCFMRVLGERNVSLRDPILQAFNEAADNAEQFSISAGSKAGHLPETLRIIEQMRSVFVGKDKPAREV